MNFEWDPTKNDINEIKHGISFVRATDVFDDPYHLEEDTSGTSRRA